VAFTRRLLSAFAPRLRAGAPPDAGGNRDPRTGQPARPVEGVDPGGQVISVPVTTGRTVLVFLTSSCQPCEPFWTGAEPRCGVFVTPSPATESRRRVSQLARPGQVVVMSSEAWHAYGVRQAPWLVVVENGTVVFDAPAGAGLDTLDS
jgi:hypothetical protein